MWVHDALHGSFMTLYTEDGKGRTLDGSIGNIRVDRMRTIRTAITARTLPRGKEEGGNDLAAVVAWVEHPANGQLPNRNNLVAG